MVRRVGPTLMFWRLWAHRWLTVPVAAVVVVGVGWGWWWAATVALVYLVAVAGLYGAGVADRLVAHEQGHRLRCRVRTSWQAVMLGAGLGKGDLVPSPPRRIVVEDGGGAVRFRAKPMAGHHAQNWAAAGPAMATHWRAGDVDVVEPLDRRGRASGQVEVYLSAHGVPHRVIPWPYPLGVLGWGLGAVPVGRAARGVATVSLLDPPHMLVAGRTGGGKSTFLNTLLAGVAPSPDVAVIVVDLKGVDFVRWRDRLSYLALDAGEAGAVLADVVGLMDARFAELRVIEADQWVPSPAGPQVVLVIDEFADLPPALHDAVFEVARKGRAAGISLVVCTQRPVATLGPQFTSIRSQLGTRIALGAQGRPEAALILGEDAMPAIWPTYPAGVARVQGVGGGRTVRVFWSNDHIPAVVAATAGRRPRLPEGSVLPAEM